MTSEEETGKRVNLRGEEVEIVYFMKPSVVKARRISGATWEVKGEWCSPFYVDEETFRKEFSEL